MEWVKIFNSKEEAMEKLIANKPRLLIIRGKRICLVVHEHQILAVADTCPHNGESLSKGALNYLGEIVCPWHGYRFKLKTGRECEERSPDLMTYPVKEEGGGIFLGL